MLQIILPIQLEYWNSLEANLDNELLNSTDTTGVLKHFKLNFSSLCCEYSTDTTGVLKQVMIIMKVIFLFHSTDTTGVLKLSKKFSFIIVSEFYRYNWSIETRYIQGILLCVYTYSTDTTGVLKQSSSKITYSLLQYSTDTTGVLKPATFIVGLNKELILPIQLEYWNKDCVLFVFVFCIYILPIQLEYWNYSRIRFY